MQVHEGKNMLNYFKTIFNKHFLLFANKKKSKHPIMRYDDEKTLSLG